MIWSYYLSGPRLARRLFASRDIFGVDDPKLSRLRLARSALGILATAAAGYFFHPNWAGISTGLGASFGQAALTSPWITYLYGGASLLICILVLAFRQRGRQRRHLLTPLYTYALAWAPLTPVIIVLPLHTLPDVGPLFWLLPFALLWWVTFVACSCFYLVRDMFRSADANPLLAPVLSIVTPLTVFLVALAHPNPKGNGIPDWAQAVMALAGVLSTGTLAAIEIHRLRHDYDISTTTAPPADW